VLTRKCWEKQGKSKAFHENFSRQHPFVCLDEMGDVGKQGQQITHYRAFMMAASSFILLFFYSD